MQGVNYQVEDMDQAMNLEVTKIEHFQTDVQKPSDPKFPETLHNIQKDSISERGMPNRDCTSSRLSRP